jgi:hypothetical protein
MEVSVKATRTSNLEEMRGKKPAVASQGERDQALADLFVMMGVSKSALRGSLERVI